MDQFFAYQNLGAGRHVYPWLINVQHPVAEVLKHALVIPTIALERLGAAPPTKICPVINIAGCACVAMTHMMAGIPLKELGTPVADLSDYRIPLSAAMDFLLNGY